MHVCILICADALKMPLYMQIQCDKKLNFSLCLMINAYGYIVVSTGAHAEQ